MCFLEIADSVVSHLIAKNKILCKGTMFLSTHRATGVLFYRMAKVLVTDVIDSGLTVFRNTIF